MFASSLRVAACGTIQRRYWLGTLPDWTHGLAAISGCSDAHKMRLKHVSAVFVLWVCDVGVELETRSPKTADPCVLRRQISVDKWNEILDSA